eukprot:1193902-Prorocentrum_minimum.AAC.1
MFPAGIRAGVQENVKRSTNSSGSSKQTFPIVFDSEIILSRDSQLPAVGDLDGALGPAAPVGGHFHLLEKLHDVHALDHAAEHDVLAVQRGRLHGGHVELRAVGVRARVRHRQNA